MSEDDKVLIVKKNKTGGQFGFSARLRRKNVKKFRYDNDYYNFPDDYVKSVNPKDPNDLALFFEDLSLMVGAPIEKAFLKFKERRGKNYPFF